MPFNIVRNDITKMNVDAIVNAANTQLRMGGGVCGAIFKAAGIQKLQSACSKLAPIRTGEAVITPGFDLKAKHIVHTAGPVYRGGANGEDALLYNCYKNSLKLAGEHKCESIAFPLISSGIYGYPKADALRIATKAIQDYLAENDMDVYLTVFDKDAFLISENLLGNVKSYIDEHYVAEHSDRYRVADLLQVEKEALFEENIPAPAPMVQQARKSIDDMIGNLDEPFANTLIRLIDSKGKTDVEVYKRANLNRRLFSKIRRGKGYMPGKRTVMALAVALELSLNETEDLLRCAGFALSHNQKLDVIVEYFITHGKYDIFEINEVLFHYDQPLLGG